MPPSAPPARWEGRGWTIAFTDAGLQLEHPDGSLEIPRPYDAPPMLRRRWFRWSLLCERHRAVHLRGLSARDAVTLERQLAWHALEPAVDHAVEWRRAVARCLASAQEQQRWLPTETVADLDGARPDRRLPDRVRAAGRADQLSDEQRAALAFVDVDLDAVVADINQQIMAAELETRRAFFDSIEKSPLTGEQARAVVCFDNRVQVLAAAGSGKTSVMVARAAYAVARGFVDPDRILLLAFNKAAALELQERVDARFAAAGIDASGVHASTFHAFGLSIIGQATGRKPRLATWLDQGRDVTTVLEIVDELRDSDKAFRYRWDLYRLLFSAAPTDLNVHEPDGYDRQTSETGYRTFGGETVKSHSERLIADFLYLNGVDYDYERPYTVDVADAGHAQYHPDFYYPAVDVWHEHWALDRDGDPPDSFDGYAQSMDWKRSIHAQHGTRLVESTWAEVMFGDGLSRLEKELTALGLPFDWNPDRPLKHQWAKPMAHEDLARFIRTFMTHVKSNSWTRDDLDRRLATELPTLAGFRTRLFLELYWPIHDAWQRRLAADHSVDFEDMLVQAADHLEAGRADSRYELVMVDEFQDASRARARLVRGLVSKPGRYLLAVGDDWQAINRFAGADLSVMTDFESWFGRGQQLTLTTTFRCTQTICDVASAFVTRNPDQFDKPMRSVHAGQDPPVKIIRTDNTTDALARYLHDLSVAVADSSRETGPDGTVTVDVLGRYRFDKGVLPQRVPANLRVQFRTVHAAKGLEADYVVVPNLGTGTYGFPSTITDDPVLALAMPAPESFPHAEERRLLYVALTRARRQVVLLAPPERISPFAVELIKQAGVVVDGADATQVCGRCEQGVMVTRRGRYGRFRSCSTFPRCDNTSKV